MIKYVPEQWKCCAGITVEQFCSYLKSNLPPNAIFHVCGCDMFYMHLSDDGTVFSVDDCSLSDLPEYEGHDPSNLSIPTQIRGAIMKYEVEYKYKNDHAHHKPMTIWVTADSPKRALARCEETIDNRYFEVVKVINNERTD